MTAAAEPIWRLPPYAVEQVVVSLAETIDWGLAFTGIPPLWQESRGEGVRVAVLDTGIDDKHPDLHDALLEAVDFSRSRFSFRDRQGHGTHVAGIVAARQNQIGVIGVAPRCELLAAKVLGDDGSGSSLDVAAGIDWAVEAQADIISMSLGSPQPSREIKDALERALGAGRFVVCAAGNDGRPESVNYPARWPGSVIVGAVDRTGRLAPYSSRGPQMRQRGICAPGSDVLSTYLDGGYARLSGTSMATPLVTGVVALLLAKHRRQGGATPVVTPADLIQHLRRTAKDRGAPGADDDYGLGLLDPRRLLAQLPETEPETAEPRLEIGPLEVNGVRGCLVFVPQAAQVS